MNSFISQVCLVSLGRFSHCLTVFSKKESFRVAEIILSEKGYLEYVFPLLMSVAETDLGGRQDLVRGRVAPVWIFWNRVSDRNLILSSIVSHPRSQ